ncbi:MAG: hypothetical protein HY245_00710 [Rhizobiales bacterium]|nr:hypothetical protein [Hyphomicrobiales bacterium]MBI3671962.1 hypothetical protein [Hyphomicrobiales bacterium]
MAMRIGNKVIHAASLTAQRLALEGRREDADAIYALVDIAINLEVRIRQDVETATPPLVEQPA